MLLHADRRRGLHNWEADLLEKWRQFSHACYAASYMVLKCVRGIATGAYSQPCGHAKAQG